MGEKSCNSILKNRDSPSLEKSTLDFMVRQELKKTFFIKEICRRIHKVLTFLSFETEMDKNLHDLGETLKLLYVLQTSKNYQPNPNPYADEISITQTFNRRVGVLFDFLLLVAYFLTVILLSINREWLLLILFTGIALICVKIFSQTVLFGKRRLLKFKRERRRKQRLIKEN